MIVYVNSVQADSIAHGKIGIKLMKPLYQIFKLLIFPHPRRPSCKAFHRLFEGGGSALYVFDKFVDSRERGPVAFDCDEVKVLLFDQMPAQESTCCVEFGCAV